MVGAAGKTAAYRRSDEDATFVVCLNAGAEPARLASDLPELSGRSLVAVRLSGAEAGAPVPVVDGRAEMEIPGRSGIVLKAEA